MNSKPSFETKSCIFIKINYFADATQFLHWSLAVKGLVQIDESLQGGLNKVESGCEGSV